jgi:hypothetical protein
MNKRSSERSEVPVERALTLDEYRRWALRKLGLDFADAKLARIYETNASNIRTLVTQHPFFVGFSTEASRWGEAYRGETRSDLFMLSPQPNLLIKPFDSVVEKTYRVNVLRNRRFPAAPTTGWVDQRNLYSKLNDLVRGTLVCRFADGPEFVVKQISQYAKSCGLTSRGYSQERDNGYDAFHCYVAFKVDLFDADWNKALKDVEVEIQITTQLQEVLRSLTHPLYEHRRLQADDRSGAWKWDFNAVMRRRHHPCWRRRQISRSRRKRAHKVE